MRWRNAPSDLRRTTIRRCRYGPTLFARSLSDEDLFQATATVGDAMGGHRSLKSGSRILEVWDQMLENSRTARRLADRDYPELARDLNRLIRASAEAGRDVAPFGGTDLTKYDPAEKERRVRAEMHAFVCGLHPSWSPCPAVCRDPYSGAKLVTKVEGSARAI